MPSPFPGMDPYLEDPAIWPSVHQRLITYAAEDLQPQLLPRYVATVEERVVLEPARQDRIPDIHVLARQARPTDPPSRGRAAARSGAAVMLPEPQWVPADPGAEVRQGYIEIRDLPGNEVVTVIEILSPSNKAPGPAGDAYRAKQQQVLLSPANLIEIDLLRAGLPTVAAHWAERARGEYVVCTRRAERPGGFELVRFGLRDPPPAVAVPLRPGDTDVVLHLGDVLARCYDVGAYAYRVDYGKPPAPALDPADAAWAEELLRAKGILQNGWQRAAGA